MIFLKVWSYAQTNRWCRVAASVRPQALAKQARHPSMADFNKPVARSIAPTPPTPSNQRPLQFLLFSDGVCGVTRFLAKNVPFQTYLKASLVTLHLRFDKSVGDGVNDNLIN